MTTINLLKITIFFTVISEVYNLPPWLSSFTPTHGLPVFSDYFCNDSRDLAVTFSTSVPIKYDVWIKDVLGNGTEITVRFDSEPSVFVESELDKLANLKLKSDPDEINNIYSFIFSNVTQDLRGLFSVQGERPPHHPPYITSLKINGKEKCFEPILDLFGNKNIAVVDYYAEAPDKYCGRRKVNTQKEKKPLIVDGSATNPGWWPWHAALFEKRNSTSKYHGAGTLITRRFILTVAHCVTANGETFNPDNVLVALGKYRLFDKEITQTQIIKVINILVHEGFNHKILQNDIALVKLSNEVRYNNYVQPACLWFDGIYDHIGTYETNGVVVGWGFDETDNLKNILQMTTMQQASDVECILYQPIFYQKALDGKKFCGRSRSYFQKGTPCNGDSGGGYTVFVNDEEKGLEKPTFPISDSGAWYLKGMVSMTLSRVDDSICDPNAYTVFTDVGQFRDWILNHLTLNT